jgi:hypothetical protein
MSTIEEKIEHMDVLATQIIDVSVQIAQPTNENLKFSLSSHRKHKHDKNGFVSELMTVIADCRKMNLNQTDKVKLDTTLTRLNEKLYAATSLTIL